MSRTTSNDVTSLLGENPSLDVTIPMRLAMNLVDANLVGVGLTDTQLTDIELFLAAHFTLLTIENGPLASKKQGVASQEQYHNVYKAGLASTRFGQSAITIDTTGILAQLSAKADKPTLTAQFEVVGDPTQQDSPFWDVPDPYW